MVGGWAKAKACYELRPRLVARSKSRRKGESKRALLRVGDQTSGSAE